MNKEEIENEISQLRQKKELNKKERKRLKKLDKRLVRENESKFKSGRMWLKWASVILITILSLWGAWLLIKKTQAPTGDIIARKGLHWHPKLTIVIDGKKQELPADIGISGARHEEIHTHDKDSKDNVVHMEMSGTVTKDETKLGNFFKIWGEEFNATQILDKRNGVQGSVKMKVNGKDNKDFENYLMKDNDTIEIRYEE